MLSIANGQTVAVVPKGWVIHANSGSVTLNCGTVWGNMIIGGVAENRGTVTYNSGTITDNYGMVTYNFVGTVTDNYGTVTYNSGVAAIVRNNYGIVGLNSDNGLVISNKSAGIVKYNSSLVAANDADGTVLYNFGTITGGDGYVGLPQSGDNFANVDQFTFVNGKVRAAISPTHGAVGATAFMFDVEAAAAEGYVLDAGGESTEDVLEDDRWKHTTTHTNATIGPQWAVEAVVLDHDPLYDGGVVGDPAIVWSSSDTGVQTIDQAGNTHYVSEGVVRFIGSSAAIGTSPARVIESEELTSEATTEETYYTVTYTPETGSCREDATNAVDNRLAGKEKLIFDVRNHTATPPVYVRNTDCWAADLDLSGISPWNSQGGSNAAGTLISPRHIIFAQHFPVPAGPVGTGTVMRFVKSDNSVVERTLLARMNAASDIGIGVLSADIDDCTFAKVLPADYVTYLPNDGIRIPILGLDREEKALVRDVRRLYSILACHVPTDELRLSFYEDIIINDSGNPAFMIINDELVILCCWWYGGTGSGPAVHFHRAAINAAMATLDSANGFTPNLTLTDIDLSGFNSY